MTKHKIMEAVIETYKHQGVEGLTMKNVAKSAGIGKSTVYEYFSSKEQMIAEAIVYSVDKYVDRLHGHTEQYSEASFEVTVRAVIENLINALKNEFGDLFAFAMESTDKQLNHYMKSEMLPQLIEISQKAIEYTWVLLKKGQEEGVVRDGLYNLDVFNFQRFLFMQCGSFAKDGPMVKLLIQDIERPVEYIYDQIIRLYGK